MNILTIDFEISEIITEDLVKKSVEQTKCFIVRSHLVEGKKKIITVGAMREVEFFNLGKTMAKMNDFYIR